MATVLPMLIAAQCGLAGVIYLGTGDWRHGIFWTAAAVINGITLTF